MHVNRLFSIALVLSFVATNIGLAARADQMDDARTLLGLATYPGLEHRVEAIGKLPEKLIPGVPLPTGLAIVGGVTGLLPDSSPNAEALFFAAPVGSLPDTTAYVAQLTGAGWSAGSQVLPFSPSGASNSLCKNGAPMVTVATSGRYLMVHVLTRGCPAAFASQIGMQKAPYPMFEAPSDASFVGSVKQTFNGYSHVAATTVASSHSANELLIEFTRQMTKAGWNARTLGDPAGDSQAFAIRDKNGVDWIASMAIVPISTNHFIMTVSAFRSAEQNVGFAH